jgi:hypothetical protein
VMDVIFSDDQLTDMTVAMVGAFPVIAVAFYAVRAGPDDLRDVPDERKRIPVPDKWAKGPRWSFLQWVTPTFDEAEDKDSSAVLAERPRRRLIPLGENVLFGADRAFLWRFTLGLIVSLGSLTFRHWPVTAHILCAVALLLFVQTVNTFVLFATQTAMLRLAVSQLAERPSLRSRKSILPPIRKLPTAEFIPFNSLVEAQTALVLTTIVSIALASVIIAGAFV